MTVKRICAAFFSPTGTTKKIVTEIAKTIAQKLSLEYCEFDFTLPEKRKSPLTFHQDDFVVFGVPVYAGRVPNVLLEYLNTMEGNKAYASPIAVYGNRNFDDALIELRDLLKQRGLQPIAAAAFIGEHSFSKILAKDRPDDSDLSIAGKFGENLSKRISSPMETLSEIVVPGTPYPYRGYYKPRDRAGNMIDIRKVKPIVNSACDHCGICARVCPMGSIDCKDVSLYINICIKCGACIKKCPKHARYYEDEGYLYHKQELEEEFKRRAEPEMFL